ncbi:MAG TPA: hypothetical protein PLK37_03760 [Terricaulis sp.]|nr:hypothetical protein [Terricaulis sp.]
MRRLVFAAVCLIAFAAAPAAFAQDEAPVDTEAATQADDCRPSGARRGVMAQSRVCRTAYSVVRQCDFAVNVRAAALRYASGGRRHARIARCVA